MMRTVLKLTCAALVVLVLCGCSTMIDKDTKLALKGPKAELSRKF